jgi:hypothetical protein
LTTVLLATGTKQSACRVFEALETSFGPVVPRRAFAMLIIGLNAMHAKEECVSLAARLQAGMELSLLSWTQVAANTRVDIDLHIPELQRLWRRSTLEQKLVCTKQLQRGQVMHVVACAGTGKTTTLQLFTAMRRRSQFLNLCYNVAVNERAKVTFGINVSNRTIHSLIESLFLMHYDKCAKLETTTLTATQIREFVESKGFVPQNRYCVPELIQVAKLVSLFGFASFPVTLPCCVQTFNQFMNKTEEKVTSVHFSFEKAYEAACKRAQAHAANGQTYKRKRKAVDQSDICSLEPMAIFNSVDF